jgi:hypothetical protein
MYSEDELGSQQGMICFSFIRTDVSFLRLSLSSPSFIPTWTRSSTTPDTKCVPGFNEGRAGRTQRKEVKAEIITTLKWAEKVR